MASGKMERIFNLIDLLHNYAPDFVITVNEIENPTLNSVEKFYERFLLQLGINDSVITLKIQAINEQDNNYKDYEDINNAFILYVCLNYLFRRININPSVYFNLSDFINPSVERSYVQMSLCANFFCYDLLLSSETLRPAKEKVLQEKEFLDQIKDEINNLNASLKAIAYTEALNIDYIENLGRNKDNLIKSIAESRSKSKENIAIIEKRKTEYQLMEEKNDKMVTSLEKIMEKCKQIELCIVNDHENIEAQYKAIENELKEEQEKFQEFITCKQIKDEALLKGEKNYEIFNTLAEPLTLRNILKHNVKLKNKNKELLRKMETWNTTENNMPHEFLQLTEKCKELEEKHQAIKFKTKSRTELLDVEVKQQKHEYNEFKNRFDKAFETKSDLNNKRDYVLSRQKYFDDLEEKQNDFYKNQFNLFSNVKKNLDAKVIESLRRITETIK